MSTIRKNKRARPCRDGDESTDAKEPKILRLFLPVVRALSQNGYIGAAELGRTASTCSSLRHASLDEEAWASLCRRRWANTDGVPRSVIEARGYRWLYRRRVSGIPKAAAEEDVAPDADDDANEDRYPFPPPPARSTHENLVVLVDISVDGEPRVSEAVTGEALRSLLEKGFAPLLLDSPVPLGKVNRYGLILDYDERCPEVHATAHILDLATNKCTCIMDVQRLQRDPTSISVDGSPLYVYGTEAYDETLSSSSYGTLRAPLEAIDRFKYRVDGPNVYMLPRGLFEDCVPLESSTRVLAERAMAAEEDCGGFEGLYFKLEASHVMTDCLDKFLGFHYVFSKFKESPLFDPNQPITHAALAQFEEEYWSNYFEDNKFDPKLSDFVKNAKEIRARFGDDTAFVSNITVYAQRVLTGGKCGMAFFDNVDGGQVGHGSFNGVSLHHLIDGLQGWGSE